MGDGLGYQILHNGVPRTFRDRRDTALEAARFAKSRAKDELIELRARQRGEARDAGGRQARLSQ